MQTKRQTLGQQRAAHAWLAVQSAHQSGPSFSEFADHAKKLPMRIRASGLGQSFAFLAAKKKAPDLRSAIASWCKQLQLTSATGPDAIAEEFRACDAARLRRLTGEVLAYMEWVVRFCDAHKEE